MAKIHAFMSRDWFTCYECDSLTDATMPEDKRKRLQTCYHYYLAAIGSGDRDRVAKCRDEMDEVLDLSGWEWRVDDRDGEDLHKQRPYPPMQKML